MSLTLLDKRKRNNRGAESAAKMFKFPQTGKTSKFFSTSKTKKTVSFSNC